jgi:hypothetical protein
MPRLSTAKTSPDSSDLKKGNTLEHFGPLDGTFWNMMGTGWNIMGTEGNIMGTEGNIFPATGEMRAATGNAIPGSTPQIAQAAPCR